jgi:type III pantothenate kinase
MNPLALSIDVGNTLIKIALVQDYRVLSLKAIPKTEFQQKILEVCLANPAIEKIIISNVTSFVVELPEQIHFLPTIQLNSNLNLGFTSSYESMKTLGVDRIALMAAAAKSFPNQHTLVIACGTCITYNFLENGIYFRGGAISPGLQMRINAMHHFTAKLPLVDLKNEIPLIGKNTVENLQSGAFVGLCVEIDGIIEEYRLQFPKINAVLTGGDLERVQTRIKSKIFADSEFLYEGLYHILLLNT